MAEHKKNFIHFKNDDPFWTPKIVWILLWDIFLWENEFGQGFPLYLAFTYGWKQNTFN